MLTKANKTIVRMYLVFIILFIQATKVHIFLQNYAIVYVNFSSKNAERLCEVESFHYLCKQLYNHLKQIQTK